ncbi:MAG: DNA (cytosine-5-)-methyltransferase [Okeania sp. SIO2H7]|nr:DNA (cytosine-5-)-methyltransferase [Okeania sp. SIO2H7]
MKQQLNVIELFAGGGGFRLGLPVDARIVLAAEKCPQIAKVYAKNFGDDSLRIADVCNIDFRPYQGIDLIVGGPPCQDFSPANNKQDRTSVRSKLALEMLRAIEETKTDAFVLENVCNFSSSEVWSLFQRQCLKLGYKIACGRLKAANSGVPQSRVRFIAVGKKGENPPQLPFPTHDKGGGFLFKPWNGWWNAIADLKIPKQDLAPFQKEAMSDRLRQKLLRGAMVLVPRVGFNNKEGLLYREIYEPAFTIRALGHKRGHWAKFNIVNSEASYLASPRCLARWQTFPDCYILPDDSLLAGRVIGNAIPPLFAKAIFDANFQG